MQIKITRTITEDKTSSVSREKYRLTIQSEQRTTRASVEKILNDDDFHGALAIVKEGLLENQWLREAYISWYRGQNKISLYEVTCLDWVNIEVFRLLCNLRKLQNWSDDSLYELELLAKSIK